MIREARLKTAAVALGLLAGLVSLEFAGRLAGGVARAFLRPAPVPPAFDGFTVLCEGDSFTYGIGAEHGYPEQLQDLLVAASSAPVRVVNRGLPGIGTDRIRAGFARRLSELRPDVVVFWAGTNNEWNFAPRPGDAPGSPPSALGRRLRGAWERLFLVRFARNLRRFAQTRRDNRLSGEAAFVASAREHLRADRQGRVLEIAERGLKSHPRSGALSLLRARALIGVKRFADADAAFAEYERVFGASPEFFAAAAAYGDAVATARRGLERFPDASELHAVLIRETARRGDFRAAREALTAARARGLDLAEAGADLIDRAARAGRLDALENDPALISPERLDALRTRAQALRERGIEPDKDPPLDDVARDLREMTAAARAAGARVFYLGYPGGSEQRINQVLRAAAPEHGVEYIDVHRLLEKAFASPKDYAGSEGHHLSDAGYGVIARELARRIAPALNRRNGSG